MIAILICKRLLADLCHSLSEHLTGVK